MPTPSISFATLQKGASRVRVTNESHELYGQTGTYLRLVQHGGRSEAWCRMDKELPADLQSDLKDRARKLHDAVLYPDEVECVR